MAWSESAAGICKSSRMHGLCAVVTLGVATVHTFAWNVML